MFVVNKKQSKHFVSYTDNELRQIRNILLGWKFLGCIVWPLLHLKHYNIYISFINVLLMVIFFVSNRLQHTWNRHIYALQTIDFLFRIALSLKSRIPLEIFFLFFFDIDFGNKNFNFIQRKIKKKQNMSFLCPQVPHSKLFHFAKFSFCV